jgi:hypothetical protein
MLFVITQFWVIPQKSPFFKIKIKKYNKGWQRGENRPGNTSAILEKIQGLIVLHYAPKWRKIEKTCKFKVKLNDYWTNLHKN